MLSSKLLPVLRERFPNRGLVEAKAPGPCATFPGIHPGIQGVSIYDDGDELTVVVEDLTHGHFAEYDDNLLAEERERRIVDAVVEFLNDLFADQVVVWGKANVGGGWHRVGESTWGVPSGIKEYVWSGPLAEK